MTTRTPAYIVYVDGLAVAYDADDKVIEGATFPSGRQQEVKTYGPDGVTIHPVGQTFSVQVGEAVFPNVPVVGSR